MFNNRWVRAVVHTKTKVEERVWEQPTAAVTATEFDYVGLDSGRETVANHCVSKTKGKIR